ncbi:hypothetical protein NG895_23465 [Aeoliella sp. ICT_H6.2]|uniref:Uncharacterized protein n=1 Tax=Aeoliella straminimaris TaxID=2954799 RepID=A0A9X2FDY6_9BACT|nr:hypothetical protein [Aeoliella straminimaris]MCO6046869.1 hypothetical protein [Aeoliella straminimaris]
MTLHLEASYRQHDDSNYQKRGKQQQKRDYSIRSAPRFKMALFVSFVVVNIACNESETGDQ